MSIGTIQHDLPSLKAKITGELDDAAGLALFRGIPYASVRKRWTHSRTMHLLGSTFDATNFGPRCVQGDGPVMVSGGTNDATPGDDEFKCLNLNITVPSDVLLDPGYRKTTGLLPVMFWIHGGAFNYGANSVGRYRPQRLSQLAKQGGTPIVLVQINYRVGPLGFVASNDLASEQSITPSETPTLGNYGFVDQQNALQWVQDHIHDFGGDPTNVTAFGVSAGSASIHYHILTGSPLFDRAILMSGSAPTLGPLPFKPYEEAWKDLCQKCGVKEEAPAQRLEILRAMKPMDIVRNYTTAAMGPLGDGVLLPKTWSLFEKQSPTRCKAIILGDTGVEGIVVDGVSQKVSQERLRHHVKSIFSASDAETFCNIFGFTSENGSYENYRDAMRLFLGLIMFQYPNLMIAEHFSNPRSAYLYHFEEPSPYEGPTFGIPYHGQCALYMYQNENEAYPEGGQRTAVEMGRIWTAFAHGKQPWEPYDKDRRFYRFGPDGTNAMFDVKTDKSRKYDYLEWLRDHFEGAKELAQGLLQGYMT